jgi:DNA-binding transcriptional ArsR family regulator
MSTHSLKALIREKRVELELAGSRSKTNPRYGRVYFELRERYSLSVEACLLLDVVEILSRKTGWCFASREYLAGLIGTSTRTVQRHLATLKEKGLVEMNSRNGQSVRATVTPEGDKEVR